MPDLLLEIGTEELPASFISPALDFLKTASDRALREARLEHGAVRTSGTPRRLVLEVEGIAARQPDREEEVTGPRADVAWAEDGSLTQAGEGFLRGRGLKPKDAYRKETKKGVVMAARIHEPGRPARDVLPELFEALLPKIPFQKTMRWTDGRETFGRPVRWLCCLLDDEPLPVRFGELLAGRSTHGHRFHAPGPFEVPSAKAYRGILSERRVMLSLDERKQAIREGAERLAQQAGGTLLEDEDLLEEVANLVEHPWPLLGRFEERFLKMPKELLLSEMREHQRYFAVVDDKGDLLPAFIVVAGSEPPDPAKVAAGNARVLRSRFEDGAFYFAEDLKRPLEDRVEALRSVIFQRQLGTLFEKMERVCALTGALADALGASGDVKERAVRAARLSKADLVTGVVGEFPELQGTMGRYYALASGEDERVAQAIEEHYQPRHAGAALPSSEEGALVAVADRVDTLVGILGIGKAPSGSADPFGLRRAAIAVLRIALERRYGVPLGDVAERAIGLFGDKLKVAQGALRAQVLDFFATRLRGVLVERCEERGLLGATDIVDATLAVGTDDLSDLEDRTVALATLRSRDAAAFEKLAATFKRVGNILQKARAEGLEPRPGQGVERLVEPAEKELMERAQPARERVLSAREGRRDYDAVLSAIVELKPHVDRFFDDVLVMTDDPALRDARLGLLASIEEVLLAVADFTRVQVEG